MSIALGPMEAGATDGKYLLSFAIFTGESGRMCAFAAASEFPPSRQAVEKFRPSDIFSKSVCSHFSATWTPVLPPKHEAEASYESAVWSEASPDVPTFIPMARM